jgi:hypothetical protein
MAILKNIIPKQNFEIVRDRLANIAIEEIENQYSYTGDPDLVLTYGVEQKIPIDKNELPLLNIAVATGNFQNRNVGDSDGVFTYNFDMFCDKSNTETIRSDTAAALHAEKIIGIVSAIFSNAQYRTLGYKAPDGGVIRVTVGQINVGDINNGDARTTIMCRIAITVVFSQTTPLLDANLLEGYDTRVKMGTSERGYRYTTEV